MIRVNSHDILPPGRFSNLMFAASSNDIASIRKYIDNEAGIANIGGKIALMFAAELGNTAAVRKLAKLEGGMLTVAGEAAIFMAIRNNNYECVTILRRYEEELTNKFGETPVQFAERLGHKSCIAALVSTMPSSWSSFEQQITLTEGGEKLLSVSQASSIHASRQSSRTRLRVEEDFELEQKVFSSEIANHVTSSNKQLTSGSLKPHTASHDDVQSVIRPLANQVDHDDKSTGEGKQSCTQEQLHSDQESLVEPSTKTQCAIDIEITDTVAIDSSEQSNDKRNRRESHTELSNRALERSVSCSSIVQTESNTEKKNQRKQKEKAVNKKEKGSKIKSSRPKNEKAYANTNGSSSTSSTESFLAAEDLSVDIDAELKKDVDAVVRDRKIVLLRPSQKRKSRKPRVSKAKTRLMFAVESSDQEGLKSHLKGDAGKAYNGLTALMLAVTSNNLLFIHILAYYEGAFGQQDGTTALMMAAERGLTEAVCILVEKEAGVLDKRGNTALMRLLELPPPHICLQVLAQAEGRIARKDGQTPLMIAVEKGTLQDVMELIPLGAGQTNKAGQTALMIAASNGQSDYIERLIPLEGGIGDRKGMTALMYAAAAGHTDCVKMLVDREKGMQTKQKWTALHYAVDNNRIECVKLLLFAAEDVPNAKGQRCLAIAKMKYFHECVWLLSQELSGSQHA